MILRALPLDITDIKYRPEIFITEIRETAYRFMFTYNVSDHNFYVSVYEDLTDRVVLEGTQLIYGKDLMEFADVDFKIVPLDFSGEDIEISYENLSDNIKLYIVDGDTDA
jgi:hypothetical protein